MFTQACNWAFVELGWNAIIAESAYRAISFMFHRQFQQDLGWRRVGYLPRCGMIDKTAQDVQLYAVTRQDWGL